MKGLCYKLKLHPHLFTKFTQHRSFYLVIVVFFIAVIVALIVGIIIAIRFRIPYVIQHIRHVLQFVQLL